MVACSSKRSCPLTRSEGTIRPRRDPASDPAACAGTRKPDSGPEFSTGCNIMRFAARPDGASAGSGASSGSRRNNSAGSARREVNAWKIGVSSWSSVPAPLWSFTGSNTVALPSAAACFPSAKPGGELNAARRSAIRSVLLQATDCPPTGCGRHHLDQPKNELGLYRVSPMRYHVRSHNGTVSGPATWCRGDPSGAGATLGNRRAPTGRS
jgi:hypothetical protein